MQVFEVEHLIHNYETDAFGRWRADAALRLMQEISGEHSERLNLGREIMLREYGCIWMIARIKLAFFEHARFLETLRVKTWYGEPGRTTYPRYVEAINAEEKTVAALACSWVLVDAHERRILLPGRTGLYFPPAADLSPVIDEPKKLRLEKTGAQTTLYRTPQYSDLDVNGHMNNVSYLSWILDLFPFSHHKCNRLRALTLSYLSEALPDEPIKIALFKNGGRMEVQGVYEKDRRSIFEAQGEWSPV